MNMEQQIERQRVLYYQSLELSRLLSDLAYEYHLKDERYERVERLHRKAEARMDRRFDRLMELHEAYMAYLHKQIDSSMKSTGLALSPAQPVEAVGQGATINEFPSFQQLNADYLVVGFFTHWGDEPTKEQIEEFAVRVNAFMFAGFNEYKSRVLAFDTIIDDRDGK